MRPKRTEKPDFGHIIAPPMQQSDGQNVQLPVPTGFPRANPMKRPTLLACLAAIAVLQFPHTASAQRADYEAMVASHASANGVPADLVHRVIVRESRYQPRLVGRGGTIGLMQIKLATARGLGYGGDAEGLRDPNTNLTYGVKYLAGAYHAANGDHVRAIHYYAAGYYQAAKRQRFERVVYEGIESSGDPIPALAAAPPKHAAWNPADAHAQVSVALHRRHRSGAVPGEAR
jgi:soluble lytic murein transglycosylase-like protein